MIRILLALIGAATICYGRPPVKGSLHVVYSKMLSEVGMLQAEPRSGVAYVYSITVSESPSLYESASFGSPDISLPSETEVEDSSKEIVAVPKGLQSDLPYSKQIKEKKTQFLSIDPFDPKANESGIS